jgi:hypothetical protein
MENYKRKFEKERIEIISQEVPQEIKDLNPIYSQIDKMPKGCAVIGGAARSLAFMMINPENQELIPVRDVDVAYFEGEISQEEADTYTEYFSPDDFSHDHGAQEVSNIEEYMNTRDFTMNQVIYKDGRLIASRAAVRDIYKGVINPCDREGGYWDDDYWGENSISTRIALKAVLQQTVLKEYIDDIKINDKIRNDKFYIDESSSYNGFQLALAIQKSFDWGDDFPKKFLQNIVESPIFESDLSFLLNDNGDVRNVYDIMTDLNEDILRYPFNFRNAALRFYMSETDDREYEAGIGRYEEFENKFIKNKVKFRGNIIL